MSGRLSSTTMAYALFDTLEAAKRFKAQLEPGRATKTPFIRDEGKFFVVYYENADE